MHRIKGLDSIRFFCALFVLFDHLGFPIPLFFTTSSNVYIQNIGKITGLVFNGPAAVIVFFIISGFCIHLPVFRKGSINLGKFYIRRIIRILIPSIVAALIYIRLGVDIKPPAFGVLWSIICELIYYILYPFILFIKQYFNLSWLIIIVSAYIIAFALLITHLQQLLVYQMGYPALNLLTFVIGLPCWLLGCWLAENYNAFKLYRPSGILCYRLFIVLLVLILRIIKFHVHSVWATNCFTLNAFAIIACFWIGLEIKYYFFHSPVKVFEWFGKWSYSLYIVHPFVPNLLQTLNFHFFLNHTLFLIMAVLLISYIFFLLIENPSHHFAKLVSSKFFNANEIKINKLFAAKKIMH